MILLTIPGSCFLYYGDEIGMSDVDIALDDVRDPVGRRRWPESGRDPMRTPMQWTDRSGAGFTAADVRPWLPVGDHAGTNVTAQRDDPSSILNLTRDLIALRRTSTDLRTGAYRSKSSEAGTWMWQRGTHTVVAVNLGDRSVILDLEGRIAIGTDRDRDGRSARDLELAPSEAVLVTTASS